MGIDVAESQRGQGVGAALTSALAQEALRAGRVPFYSVTPSNIASVATALAAGFRLGCIEAYSLSIGN
jgi:predicted GNAT family acetyltransferase